METANDYTQFIARPTDDKFKELADLADRATEAQARVERLETELKKAQEELRVVREVELPEFMEAVLGLEEVKLRDGRKVKVKEDIRASIPKATAGAAFAWLRDNGYRRLIKNVLKIEYDKGNDEEATKVSEALEKLGLEADRSESVHPSTLSAWVREKLKSGQEIPEDLLGVHRQRVASVE